MQVLYCASECAPFLKSGGLGDVAYALPKALKELDIDIRVICPKYQDIAPHWKEKMQTLTTFTVPLSWRRQYVGLHYLLYDGIPFYFIDNEYYFKRPGAYGYYDDGERYAYFCRAVTEALFHIPDFFPDIVHLNDWQTGMIPVLMQHLENQEKRLSQIRTVFTIHNLTYQGIFPKNILGEVLGLEESYFTEDQLKFYDAISFMKAGIQFSDCITTVSPTYAKEIQQESFGEGLHGLLAEKQNRLHGILNGIDYATYSPGRDKEIWQTYSVRTLSKKAINKKKLQELCGFEQREDIPLLSFVARLERQKGVDLIAYGLEELLEQTDVQLVVLGTGDPGYEDVFRYFAQKYPGRLSANILFSDSLARKIYAGSDLFLMPSLFEPCGLSQMIALRYGCIPIVRETGGLADTVIPFNEYDLTGNGFSFRHYRADELLHIIRYALHIYHQPGLWMRLMINAMKSDFRFQASARQYKNLYDELRRQI